MADLTSDAIAYSNAVIKAKQSALAKSKKITLTSAQIKTYKLPSSSDRPLSVFSKRDQYLKSIDAAGLKAAAKELGLDIKFGRDAASWKDKNPEAAARLAEITELMQKMKLSQSLTDQAVQALPLADDAGDPGQTAET